MFDGGTIMLISVSADILLVILGVMMLVGGKFGRTRQAGIAPLVMAALDCAFVTKLNPSATRVLSAILAVLQIAVLAAGGLALYQDRVRAKNKALRRQRRHDIARSRAAFENTAARRETLRVCA